MLIYLKKFFYSLLMALAVGLIVAGSIWLIEGELSKNLWLIIFVVVLVLSPRFEVVTLQSGKVIQAKGLLLSLYQAFRKWKKGENNI
jgi:hypothetical protein